ncbi:unnamed protein product [Calypogeia fissa]
MGRNDGEPPAAEEKTAADLIQEKKFQGRLERLAARNEVRQQESSARKSTMAAAIDPRESVDLFLSSFSQQREDAEIGLTLARTKEIQPTAMKDHLEKLSLDVTAMEKSVADGVYFLPASVVKASQNTIARLRDGLEIANAELVPKKKFSFRNKAKNPSHGSAPSTQTAMQSNSEAFKASNLRNSSSEHGEETITASKTLTENSSENSGKESSQPVEVNTLERIEGQSNATFARDAHELGGELTLSSLTNCKVYLRGRLSTLVIHSLKNCHVYSGPVTGSVFIESVESSFLVLASHQIRIHSTSSTDFYLRVRSRPIVEYTSNVRFAPYAFAYTGIQEDLMAANLGEETGLWEKVDDFRWLRAVHSPNWSVLPAEERIAVEDGSSMVGVKCGS